MAAALGRIKPRLHTVERLAGRMFKVTSDTSGEVYTVMLLSEDGERTDCSCKHRHFYDYCTHGDAVIRSLKQERIDAKGGHRAAVREAQAGWHISDGEY